MILLAAAALAGEVTLWHAWRGDERAVLDTLVDQWNTSHAATPVQAVFVPHESLATMAEPVAVRLPATTQLLLPPSAGPPPVPATLSTPDLDNG